MDSREFPPPPAEPAPSLGDINNNNIIPVSNNVENYYDRRSTTICRRCLRRFHRFYPISDRHYVEEVIAPVLLPILQRVGRERPSNPFHFIAAYLLRHGHDENQSSDDE